MEYCAGGSLDDQPAKWAADPVRTLRIFADICDAVDAAHQAKVTHRDLKPSNVLLRGADGPAVVADFGLAFVEDNARHTLVDEAVGPRLFMAPELEDGRSDLIGPRCDVYSLGKMLYWMLSGGRVFAREQHRQRGWNLVERTAQSRYEWVNRILDNMIKLDPNERRYSRAGEAAETSRKVAELMENNYRVVSRTLPSRCQYCGLADYQVLRTDSPTAVRNFGFQSVGAATWQILVCDHCGHVQLFRPDYASTPNAWEG